MALVGLVIGVLLLVLSGALGKELEDGQILSAVLGLLFAAAFGYCVYLRWLVGGLEKALRCFHSEMGNPGANSRPCPGCDAVLNPVSGAGVEPVENQFGRFRCTACDTALSAW